MALTLVRYKRQALAIKAILFDGSLDQAIDLMKAYKGFVVPSFDDDMNFENKIFVRVKDSKVEAVYPGEYVCQEVRSGQFVVLTQSGLDSEFEPVT